MSKNPFILTVAGILVIMTVLFLSLKVSEHKREEELARLTGNDEQTRIIRTELEEYRLLNRRQGARLLTVGGGFAVVLAALVWWERKEKREPE